ncbi:hypothetical protein RFI_16112, partial [Reticulomyxa filosa]
MLSTVVEVEERRSSLSDEEKKIEAEVHDSEPSSPLSTDKTSHDKYHHMAQHRLYVPDYHINIPQEVYAHAGDETDVAEAKEKEERTKTSESYANDVKLCGDWQALVMCLEPFCESVGIDKSVPWMFVTRIITNFILQRSIAPLHPFQLLQEECTLPFKYLETTVVYGRSLNSKADVGEEKNQSNSTKEVDIINKDADNGTNTKKLSPSFSRGNKVLELFRFRRKRQKHSESTGTHKSSTEEPELPAQQAIHVLLTAWLNVYEIGKENRVSKLDEKIAPLSREIMRWIVRHLKSWLSHCCKQPLQLMLDTFQLYITGMQMIGFRIEDITHLVDLVLIKATRVH